MDKPWYRKMFSGTLGISARDAAIDVAQDTAGNGAEEQFARGVACGAADGQAQALAQAAHWYRKAADQNHALAQFNLAMMYATGQGVAQDEAAAATWMGRAAQAGDAGAQFQLGVQCHRASVAGVRPESAELRIEAYKWLCLAAAQGYKDSVGSCERVNLDMSRDEVAEGNHRVAAFVPSNSRAVGNELDSADLDEPLRTGLGQVVIIEWRSGQH